MNVAIVGYGRMGRQIEKILNEKSIKVGATIDKFAEDAQFNQLNADALKGIDVAIDFSFPDTVIDNFRIYIENGVNVVMGTTGWFDRMDEVKKMVNDQIGVIWSGNFSLGVNLFFKVVEAAGKIFNHFSDYDSFLYEIHHNQKKDSPSGTAKMIGDILLKELDHKNKGVEEKLDRKINEDETHFASIRGGSVPGTHVVVFDSEADSVELKHTARNRNGFALGAIVAAKWIYNKKGFFSINDYMNEIFPK
jgi:4-hydroxy-tetrahydrodipicolinate reductase